jgi:hypothetical protein
MLKTSIRPMKTRSSIIVNKIVLLLKSAEEAEQDDKGDKEIETKY